MDTLDTYRQIIEQVLTPYTRIPYAYGDLQCKAIFDRRADSYMLITLGWNKGKRVHGCLVHIDIIGDKVWLQRDDTDYGIAHELEQAGIPQDHIVLGFQAPNVRPHTAYAVA